MGGGKSSKGRVATALQGWAAGAPHLLTLLHSFIHSFIRREVSLSHLSVGDHSRFWKCSAKPTSQ